MRIVIAVLTPRGQRLKSGAAQELTEEFVKRAQRYEPVELRMHETEAALLAAVERGRGAQQVVLLDSRGKSLTSEELAAHFERWRDGGTRQLVLAIGPADGWSAEAREQAQMVLSLGTMTLPHELALVVAAEQTYRALTILAGHPYHGGH
jgi:23S rRNA (pseudouridine1915-N3)-methyltransferase